MTISPDALHASPNALALHYARFGVGRRLLLTGHSHQAWPDVGFEGQQEAWEDAARFVDDKWEHAFAKADRVRRGWSDLLDDRPDQIALGASTHDLVVRFLSGLPLRARPRLVTTDGEFHTIRRQLDRLAEEGIEIVKVPSQRTGTIADRLVDAVTERTAAVLASAVLYRNAHLVPGLDRVQTACGSRGAELLVDAYHALNVVPFSLPDRGLTGAWIVGGGYKYCQLGEGNCFMRVPPDRETRPVVTGWYSEFSALAGSADAERVAYGAGPDRWAGSTYDPTSHYRAVRVLDFFDDRGLTPAFLRTVSQHQLAVLADAFDALDLPPSVITRDRDTPLEALGGFLALRAPAAADLSAALRTRDVFTDARGDVLRLGPAPYLSDAQLLDAVARLGEVARARL